MINKQYTVWCDEDGCAEWERYTVANKKTAKDRSRDDGWAHYAGDNRCPDHNTKAPPHRQ